MTRTETRQELRDHLDRIFGFWLDQALEDDNNEDAGDEETIKRKFIHDWDNGLETYWKTFKAEYKNQIRQNDQWYPRKWMEEDDAICGKTKNSCLKKYRKIFDILNSFEARKYDERKRETNYVYLLHPKSERFKKEYPHGWIYGEKKHKLAVFMTDKEFYKTILPGLEITMVALQKYLRAFCNSGILEELPKAGQYKNIPIYAIGYFSEYDTRFKLNRFLTSNKREALIQFTLHKELPNTGDKRKDPKLVYSEVVYSSQRLDIEEPAKYRKRQ